MKKRVNPYRAAKKFLAKSYYDSNKYNKHLNICGALMAQVGPEGSTDRDRIDASKHVHKMLRDSASVPGWLHKRGYVKSNDPRQTTFNRIQKYRHRWLDHLADEWDKKHARLAKDNKQEA